MAVNEQIVTGRKFRKLIDEATKLWQRISFWTKSSDVEFNDGENAETKLGAIKGITTDTNVTIPGYAADMTVVNELYGNLDELKKSVADGKALIASAITRKGIATAPDADFKTIAANIDRIVVSADTVHSVYATCTYNGRATNQMVMTLYKDGQSLGSKNYTSSAYGTYYTNTYSV